MAAQPADKAAPSRGVSVLAQLRLQASSAGAGAGAATPPLEKVADGVAQLKGETGAHAVNHDGHSVGSSCAPPSQKSAPEPLEPPCATSASSSSACEAPAQQASVVEAFKPCAAHCGFQVTWHATHCCSLCQSKRGAQHGPRCEKKSMPAAPDEAMQQHPGPPARDLKRRASCPRFCPGCSGKMKGTQLTRAAPCQMCNISAKRSGFSCTSCGGVLCSDCTAEAPVAITPDKPAEPRNPVERRSTPVKRRAQPNRIQACSSSTVAHPPATRSEETDDSTRQTDATLTMLTDNVAPTCLAWLGPKRKLSGMSFCALRANVGPQGGPATTGVTSGDLLLALASAHPRFTLDPAVAGYMRDLLKPVAADIRPAWGLKPHQEDGYLWLMGRAARRLGSVLADDMGLGKTRQAISWLLGIRDALTADNAGDNAAEERTSSLGPFANSGACGKDGCQHPNCKPIAWERALIVAPAMLVRGEDSLWVKELREAEKLWGQRLNVWQWHGERAVDLRNTVHTATWSGPMLELFDVVVVSYESFLLNHEDFCKESWTCVILDEAQKIKNTKAQTAEATKKLSKAPFRLALTGSPIENSIEDLHSILQFVQPDCAGSVHDFRERFPATEEGRNMLRKLVPSLALRRESGVAIKMVPKEEVEVSVCMSEVQQSMYTRAMEQQHSICKCIKDAELVCTHPWCYATRASTEERSQLPQRLLGEAEDQLVSDSSKMEELFRIMGGLLRCREKVLVFFCRTITSDLVAALMGREFGTRPGIVRGDTPSGERDRLIREFRQAPDMGAPSAQVLLMSVWVGAIGLNLPEARWVIHVERVWNPALERQATCRVHRITSTKPVKAYCLYTEGTIEEHKRTVLMQKHKLSSQIIEALDGDVDDEEGEESQMPAPELQALMAGLAANKDPSTSNDPIADDDEMGDAVGEAEQVEDESDGEEQSPDNRKVRKRRDQGLLPLFDRLKPRTMKTPMCGKYGDPSNKELWDWYARQGHKDIHPKAPLYSTAGLLKSAVAKSSGASDTYHRVSKFSCGPSRVHDPKSREDWEVEVDMGGATCRLFIPSKQKVHFTQAEGGALHITPPRQGALPFPILIPSFSRSALDSQVGMLDLTGTMVGADGEGLDFLQIVAVRPSEVDKYRASAPFFVVMELPRAHTQDHPEYGALLPQNLGIGSARHWLMRLADKLQAKFVFMLDDSVRAWRGVTLCDDPSPMFDHVPGKKAQFTNVPLSRVLEHFAQPAFMAEELPKFSALGFARFCPDLYRAKCAYRRQHCYSAFLLNLPKVMHEQGVNFNPNLFVWEDLDFNLRAHDVCKCFRFVMIKRPYTSGGCTSHIARTENPHVRAQMLGKMLPEQIAAEALGVAVAGRAVQETSLVVRKNGKRKAELALALVENNGPEVDAAELLTRSVFELENDPALQQDAAVCDDTGMLLRGYYKKFIAAFKDKERSRADLATGTVNLRPGMRDGEEWPDGLRIWDDTRNGKTTRQFNVKGKDGKSSMQTQVWGAGWVADFNPLSQKKGQGARWFNVKSWGTWRLAFFLARLQRAVWIAKAVADGVVQPAPTGGRAKASLRTRRTLSLKRKGKGSAMPSKRKRKGTSEPVLAICDQAKDKAQPTLRSFFGGKKQEKPPPVAAPQPSLKSFFKSSRAKAGASSEGAASSSAAWGDVD